MSSHPNSWRTSINLASRIVKFQKIVSPNWPLQSRVPYSRPGGRRTSLLCGFAQRFIYILPKRPLSLLTERLPSLNWPTVCRVSFDQASTESHLTKRLRSLIRPSVYRVSSDQASFESLTKRLPSLIWPSVYRVSFDQAPIESQLTKRLPSLIWPSVYRVSFD